MLLRNLIGRPPLVRLLLGDITRVEVDAIVNAADDTLLGGTGVDGAIREAAGPRLSEACASLGRLGGRAKSTPGFALPSRWVIHVAAPVHGKQLLPRHLAVTFDACFAEAKRLEVRSLAFPLLGAGAFGWPVEEVVEAIRSSLRGSGRRSGVEVVMIVAFSRTDLSILEQAFGIQGEEMPGARLYHPGST